MSDRNVKIQIMLNIDEVKLLKDSIERVHNDYDFSYNGVESREVLKKLNNVISNFESEKHLMK